MDNNLTIIEERLKYLREQKEFTQSEFAKLLGVSRSLICVWENGYANISLRQMIKICAACKVPLDYLLGIIDEYNIKEYNFINKLDLKYVGDKIREIRKKEHLTQDRFAQKIDTKRSSISYYEIGKMMISTADLKQICETFGVSSDYIVGNIAVLVLREKVTKIKPKDFKEIITN